VSPEAEPPSASGGFMALPKVMGIETEYGIIVRNQPDFNPILSSLLLINSYETYRSSRIRWDYEAESPLRDARGFEYAEDKDVPSKEESRLINLILSNGARFYVDHAHPEYSSPETTNPRDCVIWDRAGERILDLARTRAEAVSPPEQRILIYKNNTDSKGNSYGTHENYLMDRKVPFARIVQHLLPFFVSRQVYTGVGKVGAENNTEHCDYQMSQRADFLETEVGLETMHSRPIINTRDEPHADPEKYRRLHVIVGDANMSETANYLKCGTLALVLGLIEDDVIDKDLSVENPVLSYRKVSRDLSCRETIRLKDGRDLTPVELQWEFFNQAKRYYERRAPEAWVHDVLARWESVLTRLGRDPLACDRELDWVIKYHLIERYREKHALGWSDSRVAMIDLQYHDIRPGRGLFYKLEESDAVDRLLTEDEVTKAIYDPPKDTRAYFRGMCLQKYADEVVSASWDSVIFDLKEGPLKKIFMLEPLRGTEAHVRQLFADSPTAADLLRNLGKPAGDV
jgi:Pup amidohydrolase